MAESIMQDGVVTVDFNPFLESLAMLDPAKILLIIAGIAVLFAVSRGLADAEDEAWSYGSVGAATGFAGLFILLAR